MPPDALTAAAALWWGQVAETIEPLPPMTVSEWAARHRVVSEDSGSPYPGPWRNDRVPYLAEVMDCCGLDHPAREVTFKGGAQCGKSEVGLNLIGYSIDYAADLVPSPILLLLPSIPEARKYNRTKLQQTIDASPRLARRVKDEGEGTSAEHKAFPGGYCVVTGANSSKGLQMTSIRVVIAEEIAEYPDEVGDRGDPLAQAEARTKAYLSRQCKRLYVSTPGVKGACRITRKFEASDQRRRYVPCPHCGWLQVLTWERMRWAQDRAPYGAWFECAASGCVIGEADRRRMLAAGQWIKTYPGSDANPAPPPAFAPAELASWQARASDGREPGFHVWQAYNPGVPWDHTVHEYHQAKDGGPATLKPFYQQALGEAWEEQGDAPPAERLMDRRQEWPHRTLPPTVLVLTGAVDVQQDRLEWAVWGFDRQMGSYLIDRGMIMGSPEGPEPWVKLAAVIDDRYRDAWGRPWPADLWGVDAGYLSQQVYRFVARYATSGKVMALDGREGWRLPAIGSPSVKTVDYQGRKDGAVQLWPVGTWDLKSELYYALRLTIEGPDRATGIWPVGAAHFSYRCDLPFFQQLTAEALTDVQLKSGVIAKRWIKTGHRNEQHDLAIYCRALARHATAGLDERDWQHLAAVRGGAVDDMQGDLAALWAPQLRDLARQADAPAEPAAPEPEVEAMIDPDDYWSGRH